MSSDFLIFKMYHCHLLSLGILAESIAPLYLAIIHK